MPQPFHFAFFVRDLASTSAHTTGTVPPTQNTGRVEGIEVPMPHFGALLEWQEFGALQERIHAAGLSLALEPRIRYAGRPGEQATMFLLDPSGNALESKSFRHPEHIFTA